MSIFRFQYQILKMEPPDFIDGAKVLQWAWSWPEPFGWLTSEDGSVKEAVHALAFCQYENSSTIYSFTCDQNWETMQDGVFGSIEDAKKFLPQQYRNVVANWQIKNH